MGAADLELEPRRTEDRGLVATLAAQRRTWERRPALRSLYRAWYEQMVTRLAGPPGETVELGCGIGSFKEFYPAAIATDVQATPWAERLADAEQLPFEDGSLANLVMADVIHHLPHPTRLFAEAARTLRPGGRLIALEPYYSPVSGLAYRFAHHERADPRVDPFSGIAKSTADPLDANNALPTVLFWRQHVSFTERFPSLPIVERRRFALLAYPLSGGFTRRQLLPDRALQRLHSFERVLRPLAPLAGFRCLVVLERTTGATTGKAPQAETVSAR
jgi:SAM-dependent methyltransferase